MEGLQRLYVVASTLAIENANPIVPIPRHLLDPSSSLQYWLLLVNKGIIEATTAESIRLTDRIAFVYTEGKDARPQPVDKGDFVRFDRDETEAHVKAVYETVVE